MRDAGLQISRRDHMHPQVNSTDRACLMPLGSFVHLESKEYYLTSYDPKVIAMAYSCNPHENPYCSCKLTHGVLLDLV